MKINYKDQENKEVGDLIKFDDGAIGLVLIDEEIALLKFSTGNDWFCLADALKEEIDEGEYKIIARAKDWEINVK